MRVFVAGATGVIGRRLIPWLVDDGHDVAGMTRSPERAASVKAMGAAPVVCNAYDRVGLVDALAGSPSDIVVSLLTDLPARFSPRSGTVTTNRLRREGTRNLLMAARAAGTHSIVAESIAFLYRPGGPALKSEEDPPWLDAPGHFAETVRAAVDLERQILQAPSLTGVILRLGWLYGPGTWYASDGSIAWDVRRRGYPIIGEGSGIWSFVHVDDATAAFVAAVNRGLPGIYNIVDNDPAPMRTWLPAFARALGAPDPPGIQDLLARAAGGSAVAIASQLAGASNTKAKNELGWRPQYPSWRAALGASPGIDGERCRRMARTVLAQESPCTRPPDTAGAADVPNAGEGSSGSAAAPQGKT